MATFETITAFNGSTTGGVPVAGLTKDSAGNLYGVNVIGGANGAGTAFRLTYDSATDTYSAPRVIATFGTSATDGGNPVGTLILDGQGNVYGTTQGGGPAGPIGGGRGTVFKLDYNSGTDSYTRTTLVTFAEQNAPNKTGIAPQGNLHMDGAGNLYGITPQDGPNNNGGAIFKVTYNSGSDTYSSTPGVVASFDSIAANDLLADPAGNLYGTTITGGANGGGILFKLAYNSGSGTYASTPEVITAFNTNSNGTTFPSGRLAMDGNRNIYGTTEVGGTNNAGSVFKLTYDSGTNSYGAPVTIASFDGTTGGYQPRGGVIVDAAGNLYGTTLQGGNIDPDPNAGDSGKGTVFKISYDPGTNSYGPIQTLHRFSGTDGQEPLGTLVVDNQGRLYGTTSGGGNANGDGTVFRINDAGFVCFTTGTRIRTERGEVPVEALTVGERAVTASGEARAIRWIGHRRLAPRHQPEPQAAHPVRIAAGAFGEGRPARDLFVSPAHAIAVDVLGAVLIPACRLINGTTITQVEADEVTYWHVELDSHDILLAENLPAESYLDCGNRRFFAEADATDLLATPDARPEGERPFYRPFHEEGALVDLVRARLAARAEELGWRTVAETFAGLHLVADGRVIRPDTDGLTARFVLPAEARAVRLVSDTSVPAHVVPGASDDRRLGVAVAALTIDDGLTGARAIALDDARLGAGFHGVEGGARWTDGAARLPSDLWAGCRGTVFLRVTLAGPALPRRLAPGAAARALSAEVVTGSAKESAAKQKLGAVRPFQFDRARL